MTIIKVVMNFIMNVTCVQDLTYGLLKNISQNVVLDTHVQHNENSKVVHYGTIFVFL